MQKGLSVNHAAQKLHIHHSTVSQWRKDMPEFDAALSAAEAAFVEEQTENIRSAGKKNWTASAWLLERRWPQFFSQPQVQFNMSGGPPKVEYEELGTTIEKLRNDPKLLKEVNEIGEMIRVMGVQKWLALQAANKQQSGEKIIEAQEIKSEPLSLENGTATPS